MAKIVIKSAFFPSFSYTWIRISNPDQDLDFKYRTLNPDPIQIRIRLDLEFLTESWKDNSKDANTFQFDIKTLIPQAKILCEIKNKIKISMSEENRNQNSDLDTGVTTKILSTK
jgi:hypothetical protein